MQLIDSVVLCCPWAHNLPWVFLYRLAAPKPLPCNPDAHASCTEQCIVLLAVSVWHYIAAVSAEALKLSRFLSPRPSPVVCAMQTLQPMQILTALQVAEGMVLCFPYVPDYLSVADYLAEMLIKETNSAGQCPGRAYLHTCCILCPTPG